MNDCFICNKHAGNIETSGVMIYEDEYVYVGHIDRNGKPNYLGHIMIDLKRHVPTLAEMTVEEAQAFGVMMARVSKALKDCEKAEHIYSLVSGNSVPHLHIPHPHQIINQNTKQTHLHFRGYHSLFAVYVHIFTHATAFIPQVSIPIHRS